MEKLFSWTGHFQSFELIYVAIKKPVVAEFFFKAHLPLLAMILFWKNLLKSFSAKIYWNLLIFLEHLFCKSMPLWAHFRNTINQSHMNGTWSIGGYFIFGGHCQCQAWDMQVRKCKNIISQQFLNRIRLIQVGNIQGCFVDLNFTFLFRNWSRVYLSQCLFS